jgi:hypothetical protein
MGYELQEANEICRTLEGSFGKHLFSKLENVHTRTHIDAVAIQRAKCLRILFERLLSYAETLYPYLDRSVGAGTPTDLPQFPECSHFEV